MSITLHKITTERGKGYGTQIMLHAIDAAVEHCNATLIDIEAQEYAKVFYEGVGFKQSSDTLMIDGIPNVKMIEMRRCVSFIQYCRLDGLIA